MGRAGIIIDIKVKAMQMKVFRCRLCGEAYIGEEIPTHCPFCGAPSRHMMPAEEWAEGQDQVKDLTKVSRENLEKALGLELSNTGFYQAASKASGSQLVMAMFKRLSKVELEHAKTINRLIKPPEWEVREEKAGQDRENIGNALQREARASRFYGQALARAAEPRVRELFQILIEVEETHTNLLQNVQAGLK